MKSCLSILLISLLFCFGRCHTAKHAKPAVLTAQHGASVYTYGDGTPDGIGKYYWGREIAHVMGAAGAGWLERGERQQEENTELAIRNIELPPDGVVADIGAGSGYYTFRLAPKVPQGKVYAVEIQDEMIRLLTRKKAELKAANVAIVKCSETDVALPADSIDLAVMVDVYHELSYPHEVLQSVRKALRKEGKLLLIEYRGEDPSVPIKALHKTTVVQINREMAANGFKLYSRKEFLPIQHFLLYKKE